MKHASHSALPRALLRPALVVLLASLLAACGGGVDESAPNLDIQETQSADRHITAHASTGDVRSVNGAQATALLKRTLVLRPERLATQAAPIAGASYVPAYTGVAYFVDSALGNDTAAGTATQPWRSLARAARAVLSPGDALLLNCASRWRETVEFGAAFAPRGGALIGGYGSCSATQRPEINGAQSSATGWAFRSSTSAGDIFTAQVSGAVSTVIRGSEAMILARHPNFTAITADFSLSQAGTSASRVMVSAADRASIGSNSIAGATIVVRTAPWSIEKATVTTYDSASGNATLAANTVETPIAGAGYYLAGQRWMLDSNNEWLHDAAQSTLYYFKGRNAPPNQAPLEYTRPVTTFTVRGIPNVRIEQIRVVNSGEDGVRVIESPQARIVGIEVLNARVNGINVFSTSGLPQAQGTRVESSVVKGAGSTGIAISVAAGIVNGNTVSDISTASSDVKPVSGIRLSEADSSATANTVTRSGFKGIVFANRRNVVISKNTVREACQRLTDCGAIYAWGDYTSGTRNTVSENQVYNSTVANTNGAAGGAPQLVAGIYLDEGASNVDVTSNYIADVKVGINLHKASYNRITRNYLVATQDAAFRAQSSGSDPLSVRGNTVENNVFYIPNYFVVGTAGMPTKSGGVGQVWVHQTDAPGMIKGTAANVVANNVAVHLGDAAGLRWRMQSGSASSDYETVGWTNFAPTDRADRPFRARMVSVTGNAMLTNTTMEPMAVPWTTYSYQTNANIVTFGNQPVCGGSCAMFQPATTNDVLMQTNLQQLANPSNLMFVRYRAIGGAAPTTSRLEVREDIAPYNPAYMESQIALPANAERNQEVFFSINTPSALRVSIKGSTGATVMFDDVELYQVSSYQLLSPMTPMRLLVNTEATQRDYSCRDLSLSTCELVDEAGRAVALPVIVSPNSARMVFIRSSSWMNL